MLCLSADRGCHKFAKERTLAGLARARAAGRVGGRPRVQCNPHKVLKLRAAGHSLGTIAAKLKLTKTTVHRIIAAAAQRD